VILPGQGAELGHDRVEVLGAGALIGVEVATNNGVLGQWPPLVAGPGLERGNEGLLVDQAVLKREQSEEGDASRRRLLRLLSITSH
jgi:hypothetical protein